MTLKTKTPPVIIVTRKADGRMVLDYGREKKVDLFEQKRQEFFKA